MEKNDELQALERRVQRLQAAMGPRAVQRVERQERRLERQAGRSKRSVYSLLTLSIGMLAIAVATGNQGLLIPGMLLAVIAAARGLSVALGRRHGDTVPRVGMGADVAAGAVIEPGARVEMGADVRDGATVRTGAVVRMGADVREGAVIEAGAIVGWGCDIERGAVVEAGAVIGAGATVRAGARVPSGMRVAAGASFGGGAVAVGAAPVAAGPATPAVTDERQARIAQSCTRIEAELAQLPATFREHLGATGETATALRKTCLELLDRERGLRAEASAESLAFLDSEQAELERRVAAATDAVVKRSLESAVAAIADQKRQRLLLKTHADRIEAEVTRLQWTLEGMSTQLIRLRTAGVEAGKPPGADVLQSVQQLHEEIDAIADALEQVREGDHPTMQPIAEVAGGGETAVAPYDRVRG